MVELSELNEKQTAELIEDAVRNIASHNALWFRAAEREFGLEEALRLDDLAWGRSLPVQAKRLVQHLPSAMATGATEFPSGWSKAKLIELLGDLAKNWLANDGIWFQTVEREHDLVLAKKLNDEAWRTFTVIEAKRIMRRLRIPEGSGLNGLEQALRFRLYARLNIQRVVWQNDRAFVFQMNECRVQVARQRAGLADYPCKSAGIVEYTYFAQTIDPRIKTTCLACPPDEHPEEYWCAWQFELG